MPLLHSLTTPIGLAACLACAAGVPQRTVKASSLQNFSKVTWKLFFDGSKETTVGGLQITQSGVGMTPRVLVRRGDVVDLPPGGKFSIVYLDAPSTWTSTKTDRGHYAQWHLADPKGGEVQVESFRTGYPDSNVFVRILSPVLLPGKALEAFNAGLVFNFGDPGNVIIEADAVP